MLTIGYSCQSRLKQANFRTKCAHPANYRRTGKERWRNKINKIVFSISKLLEEKCVALLLIYRRIRFGYPFRKIPLTRQKFTIVDPEDYQRLKKYKWYAHNNSYTFYAVRSLTNGKREPQKNMQMHHLVINIPSGLFADHTNHNGFDNRKANLRPADGALVWRFDAAPHHRLVNAFGQLESPWPVPGSVLIHNEKCWFAAGRSSYLDGCIRVYALDPRTGEIAHHETIYSPDPKTAKVSPETNAHSMSGLLNDIPATDGANMVHTTDEGLTLQRSRQTAPLHYGRLPRPELVQPDILASRPG